LRDLTAGNGGGGAGFGVMPTESGTGDFLIFN